MGLPRSILSENEYLAFERDAEVRHVFVDGEIFAMAGESPEHGDISANTLASIVLQLGDGPCRARVKDTKVRSGPLPKSSKRPAGLYSYPDIVVICDEPLYHDEHRDVLLNPRAIVEVLSESTEAFDRGVKFTRYQQYNPTLTDYILIRQDQPQIEHFHREAGGEWTYRCHLGLKATLKIPSIKCRLKAAEVYRHVKFKEAHGK